MSKAVPASGPRATRHLAPDYFSVGRSVIETRTGDLIALALASQVRNASATFRAAKSLGTVVASGVLSSAN